MGRLKNVSSFFWKIVNFSCGEVQSVIDHLKKHQIAALNLGVIEIPKAEAAARKTFELAKKLGLYGITTAEFTHLLRSFKGMATKRPEYLALLT